MLFDSVRIDVTYELAFLKPAFRLAGGLVPLLSALHEELSRRFALNLSEVRPLAGTSMAEVGARVTLFNGQGVLTVAPERFTAQFHSLTGRDDLATAKDCVLLARSAIDRLRVDEEFGPTAYRLRTWLRCDGSNDDVVSAIDRLARPLGEVGLADLNVTNIRHAYRAEMESAVDGWHVAITVERSAIPAANLFLSLDYVFSAQSRFTTVDEQEHLMNEHSRRVLSHFNLEARTQAQEEE